MVSRVFVAILALLIPIFAIAQVPDEFTNLTVLPRGIQKPELLKTMRGFTFALGVRCGFCHAAKKDDPSALDFASDDKPEKKTARTMIKMMQDINKQYLAGLSDPDEKPVPVMCATCHHGQEKPRTLEMVLQPVIEQKGVPAAIEKYKDLKKQYYGSYTFDFRDVSLVHLGSDLADAGKVKEALAILQFNEEMYPQSERTEMLLGDLYLKNNDKAQAIAHYKKYLALEPDDDDMKKTLNDLTKPSK